jgi:hypothetical protein
VNIRRELVLRVLAKEAPVAELARQYGSLDVNVVNGTEAVGRRRNRR